MEKLKNEIKNLVADEIERALEVHGRHHSRHEAYAVIKEEVEEADDALVSVKQMLAHTWEFIKGDDDPSKAMKRIGEWAEHLAAEAIQVAAMAQKGIEDE